MIFSTTGEDALEPKKDAPKENTAKDKDFEQLLIDSWNYPGNFTKNMVVKTADDKSLLYMVVERLELKYYREYWLLDAVLYTTFYEKEGKELMNPSYSCAEYLPVIIEHENNMKDSSLEMNKLSIFNSPLKVLITYPEGRDKDVYLNAYAEILKKADVFDDFSTMRKHLVILGSRVNGEIFWEFFAYKNGGWIEISKPKANNS
ncbi:hypothetical protein M0P98_01430 [bacterium]|nr:hypothetical protein [bacterium]